jgi:hypothetical protein
LHAMGDAVDLVAAIVLQHNVSAAVAKLHA